MADVAGVLRIDVDIHCPRCGRLKITTLKRFVEAINDGSPLICGDCDSKFIVKLELLDPPARTSDTAETPIREVSYADPFTNYLYHRASNALANVLRKLLS